MLDFFTIFSKGGIVLWCFPQTSQAFTSSVNALIKSVILQERGGSNSFTHEALTLKYKLDNEFELVFVVAYQKFLQLSYVDKFLNDIQIEFRNKYKDDLLQGPFSRSFEFFSEYEKMLLRTQTAVEKAKKEPRAMRTFTESQKSQKKVSSMIESRASDVKPQKKANKTVSDSKAPNINAKKSKSAPDVTSSIPTSNGQLTEDQIRKNREKLFGKNKKSPKPKPSQDKPEGPKKNVKAKRVWSDGPAPNVKDLDFSNSSNVPPEGTMTADNLVNEDELELVGQMKGGLQDMEPESSSEEEDEEEDEPEQAPVKKKSGSRFGLLSGLRSLVGSKTLTREDINPALDKMRDHLIAKNVAADIADKLCESVATKLEGRVLGTFSSVSSTVKQTLHDACVQILSPKRRVDILRDAMEARQQRRPFTIAFCGVNGVGKSTNLAKLTFWLVENGLRVLIAACDTFRAAAVEQLRIHRRKLSALHPPESHGGVEMVHLHEKGYGKDPAGVAMEGINVARDRKYDVVLIDTAGRMQDNEPLMKELAKLIKVNQPDLVLFVGEALVGNEAVDQLVKFNRALADNSQSDNPRLIDGILLTKFDTIDDKVGAAISMAYITGQPIVFVGTGQTYTDLKNLNARAVVHSLLKP